MTWTGTLPETHPLSYSSNLRHFTGVTRTLPVSEVPRPECPSPSLLPFPDMVPPPSTSLTSPKVSEPFSFRPPHTLSVPLLLVGSRGWTGKKEGTTVTGTGRVVCGRTTTKSPVGSTLASLPVTSQSCPGPPTRNSGPGPSLPSRDGRKSLDLLRYLYSGSGTSFPFFLCVGRVH